MIRYIRYSVIIQSLEECVQTASQNLWNRRRERKQPDVLDPAWGCKCHARHRYIVIIKMEGEEQYVVLSLNVLHTTYYIL